MMRNLFALDPTPPTLEVAWRLFNWSLGIGTAIFVLVTGLVIYAVIRFPRRQEHGEPRQIFGNTKLEIAWTIAPVLLLVGLFIPTLAGMRAINPPPPSQIPQEPDIIVTGYQWWWRVEYPKLGILTANEIHIPVGQRLLVRLEANDVIHSFWVPELIPKHDMIPGDPNNIWLEATEPGTHLGVCTEYCGTEHAKMLFYVVAEPQADFERWRDTQLLEPPQPTLAAAVRGALLYQQLTCVNCHAIGGGQGAVGVGPNLTHFGSRLTIGAGAIPNTPENLALWIADPQAIKPGVYMPGYGRTLSDEQILDLVAYLETLK